MFDRREPSAMAFFSLPILNGCNTSCSGFLWEPGTTLRHPASILTGSRYMPALSLVCLPSPTLATSGCHWVSPTKSPPPGPPIEW